MASGEHLLGRILSELQSPRCPAAGLPVSALGLRTSTPPPTVFCALVELEEAGRVVRDAHRTALGSKSERWRAT